MLKKILCICAVICSAAAAHASVTIVAQALTPNLILSSGSTALATGDEVRIGTFSSTSTLGTSNVFSSLNALFTPIGEGEADGDSLAESPNPGNDIMDINNPEGAGTFGAAFDTVSASYFPTGTQLYLWIFNSATPSTATQWAILDAPSWTFPADPSQVNLSLSSASINVIRGSTAGTDYELANIPASVPEPSNLAAFGALAVFGSAFLLRRRTRA